VKLSSALAGGLVAVVAVAATALSTGADGGSRPATAGPNPCIGAAARDQARPCRNTTRTVTGLDNPDRPSSVACRPEDDEQLQVCGFGASRAQARATFALIGDSHAAQWLPALGGVARANRWRGLRVTTSGCYFSEAVKRFPAGPREGCTRWYGWVLDWLRRHPEVGTVFVAQRAAMPLPVRRGESAFAVKSAGFRRTWTALPPSIARVVVLRDVPESVAGVNPCLAGVVAAALPPGPRCLVPRSRALKPDPAVAAVRALDAPRYRAIDLTPYFCSPRSCYAVVGGVLVHRDIDHMTAPFSASLGPYLLRAIRRL
jgi:hypothetical protein